MPVEEEEVKEKKVKEPPKPRSGPNIVVVIAVLLAVQALVAFLLITFALPPGGGGGGREWEELFHPEAARQVNPMDETIIFRMETTLSIVGGPQGMHFVRARLALATDRTDKANNRIESGILGIETQIRSRVNGYLSSLSYEEVTSGVIRDHISASLLREINSLIAPANIGKLSNVHIEEFLVQ